MKRILLLCSSLLFGTLAFGNEIVTTENFVRAESDMQMKTYVDTFNAFGRFHHNRAMYDVTKQLTIRPNTDTMYSFGIFDLTEDVTLTMPKTNRYQSAMVVNQDHSLFSLYEGEHKLTQESIGTRYIFIVVRTFVDPSDKADLKEAHATQDMIQLKQTDKGSFEVPAWDEASLKAKRQDGAELSKLLPGTKGMFGDVKKLNPVISFVGAACCWGGLPEEDAYYGLDEVEKNDGKTVHTITVKDVPVKAFWSITVYNKEGYFDINERGVYSVNSKTVKRNSDGSATIQFGNCSAVDNCLDISDGWNYTVRQYQPQESILNGSWAFPKPTPM